MAKEQKQPPLTPSQGEETTSAAEEQKIAPFNSPTEGETTGAEEEKAGKIFKNYPKASEVYFTSDGFAFLQECNAKNHAASLKDKEIKIIKK